MHAANRDDRPDRRLDTHNRCVDEEVAAAGLCATTDLRTGRTCILPEHHRGSCEFASQDAMRDAVRRVNAPTGTPR